MRQDPAHRPPCLRSPALRSDGTGIPRHECAGRAPSDLTLLRSYGLRPDLLAMSQVWRGESSVPFIIATKGAPEAIATFANCSRGSRRHGWSVTWTQWRRPACACWLSLTAARRANYRSTSGPAFDMARPRGPADPLRDSVRKPWPNAAAPGSM